MPRLPLVSAALLLVIAPCVFCGQTSAPASLSNLSPPLPSVETPLWRNAFVIAVGNTTQTTDIVMAVLEKAVRDQYTQIGYGVSIVQFQGCIGTSVYSVNGYVAPPDLAPGPGPAYVGPTEPSDVGEIVYSNPNGTYTGAPLSMPLSDNGFVDQPNPLSPSTLCYRMNSTIYYEPGNSTYLDPSQGTSNELMTAISEQAYASGVWAQFFLLNITVLPSAAKVVYTGDKLEHLTETGYLTTIRVTGEKIVPCLPPRHVVFLAAFRSLNLYNTTNMVRDRFSNITQDSSGFNVTYLSIVRPGGQETLPEAIARVLEEGSLLQTVQEAGLPATNLSLIAIQEDNTTTLGNQLSTQVARLPVISPIGLVVPGSPGGAFTTSPGGQTISSGAIAGIAVGGAAALGLLAIIGAYVLRRHLAFQKSVHATEPCKPQGAPPPAPNSSPQGSSPSDGTFPWANGVSMAPRHTTSPSQSLGSGESRLNSLNLHPSGSWPLYGTTGGSWQLEEGSVEICRRPDGSDWVLGAGSFGVVYKGLRDGVQEVAIKKLTHVDGWQLQQFQKEIDLLRALSYDKNVVQFFGASMQPDNPVLVLEYMGGGDLRKVLDDPKNASKLIWHRKGHQIALDIARGLVFLHKRRIIHADLKSKNILLSNDLGTAKLADVGLSRIMQGSQASSTPGMVGTFSHAAPEMILGYKVNEKVDVWSLGVVLHEIITREPPVRGQLHSIDAPRQCPPEIKELVTRCMHRSPHKRPSAKEVYKIIQESAEAESGSDDEPTSITPVLMPAMAER